MEKKAITDWILKGLDLRPKCARCGWGMALRDPCCRIGREDAAQEVCYNCFQGEFLGMKGRTMRVEFRRTWSGRPLLALIDMGPCK